MLNARTYNGEHATEAATATPRAGVQPNGCSVQKQRKLARFSRPRAPRERRFLPRAKETTYAEMGSTAS